MKCFCINSVRKKKRIEEHSSTVTMLSTMALEGYYLAKSISLAVVLQYRFNKEPQVLPFRAIKGNSCTGKLKAILIQMLV